MHIYRNPIAGDITMKKITLILIALLALSGHAYAQANATAAYIGTSGVVTPVTTTTGLPISVYDSGNHSGYCYTSNGSGSPATFQPCSGSGGTPGGSSGQIQTNNGSGGFGFVSSIASGFCNSTAGLAAFISSDCASFFGYYDPAWYGAKGNGTQLTNVSTTSASATVTSSGITTSNMSAGQLVSIWAGTPINLTGCTTAFNSYVVTCTSTTGLKNGYNIQGTVSPVKNYVTGVLNSTTFTVQIPLTNTGGSTLTVYPIINTTVSSVTNGSAVLATNALATISGAAWMRWGTSDSTAINSALTAASTAGGGTVQLQNATYISNSPLQVNNRVSIRGQGAGKSIVEWLSTSDMSGIPVIVGFNQANSITCDYANALANQSDNQLTYFEIDALAATAATFNVQNKGIGLPCSVRSVVDHLYVHDTPETGIATDEGFPTLVTNNVVENCGRLGGGNPGGNCIGEGTIGLTYENYIITGNTVKNPSHYGIFIESEGTSTVYLTNTIVANNSVYQGGNSQNTTSAGNTATAAIANSGTAGMSIVSNNIYGVPGLSAGSWFAIAVDGGTLNEFQGGGSWTLIGDNFVNGLAIVVDYIQVSPSQNAHILISNNVDINSNGAGIQIITTAAGGKAEGIDIIGNHVFNAQSSCYLVAGTGTLKDLHMIGNTGVDCGISTATAYRRAGFATGGPIAGLTMHGNSFYDDGAATQQYAVAVNTGIAVTGADISGNNFSGNVTSALDMLGTITGIVQGNVGMPAPTITGCGTVTNIAGNGDIGKFNSNTTGSCAAGITPYGTANIIAPNGYDCVGQDLTTGTDILTGSASTTTSCTLTGPTVSGDLVHFQIRMW